MRRAHAADVGSNGFQYTSPPVAERG